MRLAQISDDHVAVHTDEHQGDPTMGHSVALVHRS